MGAHHDRPVLGVIGGSGLYHIEGLEDVRTEAVPSPFGAPSDEIVVGTLGTQEIAFLPRHGRGHVLSPDAVNYRANIDALKRLGVTDILAVTACGSYREEIAPGTFVIVDQFIDRTHGRASSFFGAGFVAHVSMAEPVCARLGDLIEAAAGEAGVEAVRGGTYVAMEGPQFSTRAESELYRSMSAHVIGMTGMPEAKLAREAEICYATLAMVTDYDCWRDGHAAVEAASILALIGENAARARAVVGALAPRLEGRPRTCPAGCDRALDTALVTAEDRRDSSLAAKLDAVAGRLIGQ